MANFKVDGERLHIGGDVTISSGESLLNFLRNNLRNGEHLTIDLKTVDRWDSSAIQLFLSWMKTMKNTKTTWTNLPKEMAEDIKLMGLSKQFNGVDNG